MEKSKLVQWMNKKIKFPPDMILSLPKGGIEKVLKQGFIRLARNPQLKLRYIYLCENGHKGKPQTIATRLENFKIYDASKEIIIGNVKIVNIPVAKYGYERITNRAYINFTCPACGNKGLNGGQMIQNFSKCRECRATSRLRARGEVERHPKVIWEDVKQFCAADFAVNKEEIKEAIEWCKNTPVIPLNED